MFGLPVREGSGCSGGEGVEFGLRGCLFSEVKAWGGGWGSGFGGW